MEDTPLVLCTILFIRLIDYVFGVLFIINVLTANYVTKSTEKVPVLKLTITQIPAFHKIRSFVTIFIVCHISW
jgi:hypothetical protein